MDGNTLCCEIGNLHNCLTTEFDLLCKQPHRESFLFPLTVGKVDSLSMSQQVNTSLLSLQKNWHEGTFHGEWKGRSAGGSVNNRETFLHNPQVMVHTTGIILHVTKLVRFLVLTQWAKLPVNEWMNFQWAWTRVRATLSLNPNRSNSGVLYVTACSGTSLYV